MVRTNALVDDVGFPIQATVNWSCSSPCKAAVHYILIGWLSTSVSINSHTIGCCFLPLLYLILCTIVKWTSWVTFLVAALAVSLWTNWSLYCCCVSVAIALHEVPVVRLDLDPVAPGWRLCRAIAYCGGKGKDDDNEMKWELMRNI